MKKKKCGHLGFTSGPQAENVNQNKLNMRLSVAQGIRNRVPLPNSVLIHKSYMIKYLINAAMGIEIETLAYLQDAKVFYHIMGNDALMLESSFNDV